jgi:uncharacterized damage-inducible protein DinB
MREPRYRFPDHVRDTTRTIATRMVREDAVARTPEELEAWIAEEPRPVGRAGYPSTVRGLLHHADEHTARHAGQISTTVRVLQGPQTGEPGSGVAP